MRQRDILSAAEHEFALLGWSGARVERIARKARVNKQLLFHYFESKSGLFEAALGSLLARFASPVGPVASPVEEVRRIMRTVEAAARAIPGVLFGRAPTEEDAAPAVAVSTVRAWRERQRARLADAVTEGQRRGHFRDDLDPETAAEVGLAMALGLGALDGRSDAATWMVDYCAWR